MNPTIPIILAATLAAGFAQAVTLTEDRGGLNAPHTVTFTERGTPGTGRSAAGAAYQIGPDGDLGWQGRFNAYDREAGGWWNNRDNDRWRMDLTFDRPTDRVSFAVTDLGDVPGSRATPFQIRSGGVTLFEQAGRQANGNVRFFTALFDGEVLGARFNFALTPNDTIGVALAPVPIPPALALLLGGFAAMFGLSWRKRRAV